MNARRVSLRTLIGAGFLLTALTAPAVPQTRTDQVIAPTPAAFHDRVPMLSRDLETRLAVNALPKELRDGATVLALEAGGYVKARSGTNPFTCIVSRRGGNFYPVCFDEEGSRTILRRLRTTRFSA